jgi:DedD protein
MAWSILDPVKERLTGAIILVALIVLLVPELLTGPIRAKSALAASATAASPPVAQDAPAETPLRSYTLTLGAAPSAREAAAAPSASAVTASAQPAESSAQVSPQSFATSPAASAKEGTSKGPHVGTEPQAAAPSRESGPGTQTARLPQQRAASEPDLEAAKPPIHPSVREARSLASSTGWVVQLGSFASRGNADRLAHSLGGRGFHMSVSPARTGSHVLWRVRVGPAHDRAGAQRLAIRLRALGHRGELLPVR